MLSYIAHLYCGIMKNVDDVSGGNVDPYKYNMAHEKRGVFLLVNNMKFDNMDYRTGSDVDAGMLERYPFFIIL